MFATHSQIICTIFGMHIYFYGVVLALAILIGTFASEYIGTVFYKFQKETVIDMVPYLVLFGIIGARLYYCILNSDFYLRFPTEILAIRHGGISIHGAILGGFLGLLIFAKRRKLPFLRLADVSAAGLALAQSVGRWGNFFNSEAFGTPTELPWKLYIAPQYRPVPYQNYEYFHPAFLYESILDFVIFGILFLIFKYGKTCKDGNVLLLYLILYSLARIAVEYCRIDSVLYIYGIPVAIIVSAVILILSSTLLLIRNLNIGQKE